MQKTESGNHHTTSDTQDKPYYTLKKKFIFGVTVIIVPVLGLLFTWISVTLHRQAKEETLEKARVVADQIILTRQWVTDCMGGVFVHTAAPGARDVTYATRDRIVTDQGVYQLFTPSMVTKKLSQYSFREKSYQFRLTSLHPLNQANQPDSFEAEALKRFSDPGFRNDPDTAVYTFTPETLEYIVPLYKKRGCVKCHSNQAIQQTSIVGGLRITIPYEKIRQVVKRSVAFMAGAGLLITVTTVLVLIVLIHFLVLTPLNELEDKSRQLSRGNLSSRVTLHTHDELERLGSSFNLMADSLLAHRTDLEEKVNQATRDLAQANHELMKLDKLKSDFLANMSHELRTPLTAVKGSVDYLERTVRDKEALACVRIIEKNTARLNRLIANLFDFTKLEAGKIDWEFEREDLAQLMTEVADIMGPIADAKEIVLEVDAGAPVFAVIDLERMEQVLVNLMENAVKFSPEQTRVRTGVKDKYSHVELFVQDQGPGIPAAQQDTIFEKFHSGSARPRHSDIGAGMGLAICKAIVTAHGGEILVESREGEYSRFTILLPKEADPCNQHQSEYLDSPPCNEN